MIGLEFENLLIIKQQASIVWYIDQKKKLEK